jgi:uncharacterized protein (TIGR00255 family)
MIKSMTGFASLTRDDENATIGVTVRAVNHKFLDLQLRIPPSLAAAESRLRALVQKRVGRGRIEVSVSVTARRVPMLEVQLNESFLEALGAALDRARERGYVADQRARRRCGGRRRPPCGTCRRSRRGSARRARFDARP